MFRWWSERCPEAPRGVVEELRPSACVDGELAQLVGSRVGVGGGGRVRSRPTCNSRYLRNAYRRCRRRRTIEFSTSSQN